MEYVKRTNDVKQISERNTIHGFSRTIFYSKWLGMNRRCNDVNYKSYKHYHGRGIKVCKRWNKFENFRDDMYPSYLEHVKEFGKDTTLDRINNNGNYSKTNCKWSTNLEQARNKRETIIITLDGKTQCLSKWAIELGIERKIIWQRINRDKWPIKKALTSPLRDNYLITYKGKTQTLANWAKEMKIDRRTISYRIKSNWPIKKALTNSTHLNRL